MIYHPRPYTGDEVASFPTLVPLDYTTSQGRQRSYYLPPRTMPMRKLWVLFSGNGSRALDWPGFLDAPPDSHDGCLLVEYPGYGACAGSPSPRTIQESAEAAFALLAGNLHKQTAELEPGLNVIGVSLGCATGLNFATRHHSNRIIMVAPFTTMRDMARRTVGWPLCWLLLHNYDNSARLADLAASPHPPKVDIFHGDDDQYIPQSMGKQLATQYPHMITFHSVPGAGHNTVLDESKTEIFKLMRE